MNTDKAALLISALWIFGGTLVGGLALAPHSHAEPSHTYASTDDHVVVTREQDLYAYEVGDDNGDGVIMEDESGWDCHTMGNHICGPVLAPGEYVPGTNPLEVMTGR